MRDLLYFVRLGILQEPEQTGFVNSIISVVILICAPVHSHAVDKIVYN